MKTMTFFLLFIPFITMSAFADSFRSQVHSLHQATNTDERSMIKFTNGRVAFFVNSKNEWDIHPSQGQWVEVRLDSKYNLLSIQSTEADPGFTAIKMPPKRPKETVLMSSEAAKEIFNKFNPRYYNESQCYNRAHIWTYEENKRSQIVMKKLFLFFTNKFIRDYTYRWWFHVSPAIDVSENGNTSTLALDYFYMWGPKNIKSWTDFFVYSKRSCPIVQRYSQYERNQETEDCYLMSVSMYNWQPRDLDNYERTGYMKTTFIQSEVDWAYNEAFY